MARSTNTSGSTTRKRSTVATTKASRIAKATSTSVERMVDFIHEPSDSVPFSDLGGGASADNVSDMLDGWRTLRRSDFGLEVAVGRAMTVPSSLLTILAKHSRAVARITASGVDWAGRAHIDPWMGTGFLVGPNLLLTNHHVLNSLDVARDATVEFDYEAPVDALVLGVKAVPTPRTLRLDPERLFVTSPVKDGLDYTFIWIEDGSADYPTIAMERASFTAAANEQAFIIHHPEGRLKQASLDDTDVLGIQSTVIHYASDTEYGSSGAPVFDLRGRLIALHHAREERVYDLPDGGKTKVVNEGIKIGAIAVDLENRVKAGKDDATFAARVLQCFRGSDTLVGYFGALGREVRGASDLEAVVNTYKGTDQDLDVGFWNIEWLANRYKDETKLGNAARVIVDLNLDIWALSEASPNAVQALLNVLDRQFGEKFAFGFSEPDAPDSKQTTAVIWKTKTVDGEAVEWPSKLVELFNLDSRDPRISRLEVADGKVFPRYPGLFQFSSKGRKELSFNLVPLHLKAMAEGSKRRKLASKILASAINIMIKAGYDEDWVIGGDMNATLASGDFEPLGTAKFVPLSAEDAEQGAFTYLKSPKSLIDHIYLSPNIAQTSQSAYFIVAEEKQLPKFIKEVSDHRPVLVRFSSVLGTRAAMETEAKEVDVDDLVKTLTASAEASSTRTGRRRTA